MKNKERVIDIRLQSLVAKKIAEQRLTNEKSSPEVIKSMAERTFQHHMVEAQDIIILIQDYEKQKIESMGD